MDCAGGRHSFHFGARSEWSMTAEESAWKRKPEYGDTISPTLFREPRCSRREIHSTIVAPSEEQCQASIFEAIMLTLAQTACYTTAFHRNRGELQWLRSICLTTRMTMFWKLPSRSLRNSFRIQLASTITFFSSPIPV